MVDLSLLRSVLDDVCRDDETLAKPLGLDFSRVQKLVDTRGLSIILIDFPDACKTLDASLSRGYLNPKSLPNSFGKRSLESGNWLFGTLFLRVFNEFGTLIEPLDIRLIFFLRQILLLYKKIDIDCPEQAIEKSVNEFYRIESEMRRSTLSWNLDSIEVDPFLSFLDSYRDHDDLFNSRDHVPRALVELLDTVSARIGCLFPILDAHDIVPRHGPGAVADRVGRMYDKYTFPTYPDKLNSFFPMDIFAFHSMDACLDSPSVVCSSNESPAQLKAVPKTYKGPRLIATEPTSHQFLQQGLMRWFRDNLPKPLRQSINFNSQVPSQMAALRASADGESTTMDLSSASDRLSCWAVERFFRKNPSILQGLHAVRTRTLVDKTSRVPRDRIFLKKYANQGSAVTFTVQSICYTIACITCVLYERGLHPTYRNICDVSKTVRVFGDDLLFPKTATVSIGHLLTYLGLKVNMGKTHSHGQFRESCGIDALAGQDISPVYLSNMDLCDHYDSLASWIEVSNNAYRKGLWSLSSTMISRIPEKIRSLIPISYWPHSGLYLHTFQKLTYHTSKGRWSKTYQKGEVRAILARVRADRGDRVDYQGIYQYFIDKPDPLLMWNQGFLDRPRTRRVLGWVS